MDFIGYPYQQTTILTNKSTEHAQYCGILEIIPKTSTTTNRNAFTVTDG